MQGKKVWKEGKKVFQEGIWVLNWVPKRNGFPLKEKQTDLEEASTNIYKYRRDSTKSFGHSYKAKAKVRVDSWGVGEETPRRTRFIHRGSSKSLAWMY